MNNMNGIISEAKRIFNAELELKDTKNGAMRATTFYTNAKEKIAEHKEKTESLSFKQEGNRIVTGEELRRHFDRNYDMENHGANSVAGNVSREDSSVRDEGR